MAITAALGERRTVELPAGTIEYRERGQGRPVVFVHGVGVNGEAQLTELLGLSLADEPGAIGGVATRGDARCIVGSGRVDEGSELVEAGLGLRVRHLWKGDADQNDALAEGAFDERRSEGF